MRMSMVLGKFLKVNHSVDGIRENQGRFQLPTGRVRLFFGFLSRRRLSTDFVNDLKSTPRQTYRSGGSGGMLF